MAGLSPHRVQLPQNTQAASNPIIRTEDLLRLTRAYLNRIPNAVSDLHDPFVIFPEQIVADLRPCTVFRGKVGGADSARRYSFLDVQMFARQLVTQRGQRESTRSFDPGLTAKTVGFHGV